MESLAHNFVPRLIHEKCETSSFKKKTVLVCYIVIYLKNSF